MYTILPLGTLARILGTFAAVIFVVLWLTFGHAEIGSIPRFIGPSAVLLGPRFNEEVQHLERRPTGWYSRWLWEQDTGSWGLRSGTG